MLVQLGQVSLYQSLCQSNQWFINRRANDEGSQRTSGMKTTSSNRSTEKEEERERKRHGEHCIAKRIAENRQANSEKGKQGLEGVEGLAGRFAVCLDGGP